MNNLLSLLMTQTWQIAALAMIVAVVVKLAAKNRPHLAHALWILVLIKCVTPPLWGHSLGVFSQMQTLIGHDSDESTVDAESIVALICSACRSHSITRAYRRRECTGSVD